MVHPVCLCPLQQRNVPDVGGRQERLHEVLQHVFVPTDDVRVEPAGRETGRLEQRGVDDMGYITQWPRAPSCTRSGRSDRAGSHSTASACTGRRRDTATTSHCGSEAKWRTAAWPTSPDAPAIRTLNLASIGCSLGDRLVAESGEPVAPHTPPAYDIVIHAAFALRFEGYVSTKWGDLCGRTLKVTSCMDRRQGCRASQMGAPGAECCPWTKVN